MGDIMEEQRQRDFDATVEGRQDVWNIGPNFTTYLIFKPLFDAYKLKTTALYGTDDMFEFLPTEIKTEKRIEALQRYKDILKMLMTTIAFIVKSVDAERFNELRKKIDVVDKRLQHTYYFITNNLSHQQHRVINETLFSLCFADLQYVEEKLYPIMNHANLLFKLTEDMKLDDIMKDIEEGG
jgi:hypothetical protein